MIKLNIQLADKEINSPMTVRARPSGERFSFLDSITKTYRMDRTPTAKTAAVPPVTSLITAEPPKYSYQTCYKSTYKQDNSRSPH